MRKAEEIARLTAVQIALLMRFQQSESGDLYTHDAWRERRSLYSLRQKGFVSGELGGWSSITERGRKYMESREIARGIVKGSRCINPWRMEDVITEAIRTAQREALDEAAAITEFSPPGPESATHIVLREKARKIRALKECL